MHNGRLPTHSGHSRHTSSGSATDALGAILSSALATPRRSSTPTPNKAKTRHYVIPFVVLFLIVFASATQTETASYLASYYGFDKPYFGFFVTHSTFALVFPVHFGLLVLFNRTPRTRVERAKQLLRNLRSVLADQLGTTPRWRQLARPLMAKIIPPHYPHLLPRHLLVADEGDKRTGTRRVIGDGIMVIGAILLGLYEVVYKMVLPESQGGATHAHNPADDITRYSAVAVDDDVGVESEAENDYALGTAAPQPQAHTPLLPKVSSRPASPVLGGWGLMAVVAVGGSIYNAGLMILIGIWGPTTSSVANLLTIGVVAVFDAVWMGHVPDLQTILGAVGIAAGFGLLLWEGEED
ncbi:hypothetical protein CcaverHIS002_0311550 [Cutaneotrichosporon cavernicola]|nr:hypothetical protein CcaverHIS002_0311550 [Cutaneotrichosporon cavernicola]